MIETVFALLLSLNGQVIEHTYKKSLSECLKSKRVAMREVNPDSVVFSCIKTEAKTEIYMGQKKILKIIKK
mgnify:FL=1|jgi:hypothetical protein|tara:strand:+ start:1517 stop:1729 length:213 start_codon:yes stop_codon:yes gene_type:complete